MKVSSTFRPVNSLNSSLTRAASSKDSLFISAVNRIACLVTPDIASHSGLRVGTRMTRRGLSASMSLSSGL